jgi:hypothetical protein
MSNLYTTEQKEYIRANYNNPFDCTMFCDKFHREFNRELNKEGWADIAKENLKLYGDVGMSRHWRIGKDNLPRIKLCQLYVVEPFKMANGKMSREQTVYLRDTTKKSKMRYPKEAVLDADVANRFFNEMAEMKAENPAATVQDLTEIQDELQTLVEEQSTLKKRITESIEKYTKKRG